MKKTKVMALFLAFCLAVPSPMVTLAAEPENVQTTGENPTGGQSTDGQSADGQTGSGEEDTKLSNSGNGGGAR